MLGITQPFVVIKFKKLPKSSASSTRCVPKTWIKCVGDSNNVAVSFPDMPVEDLDRKIRLNKPPLQRWPLFPANIVAELDSVKLPYIQKFIRTNNTVGTNVILAIIEGFSTQGFYKSSRHSKTSSRSRLEQTTPGASNKSQSIPTTVSNHRSHVEKLSSVNLVPIPKDGIPIPALIKIGPAHTSSSSPSQAFSRNSNESCDKNQVYLPITSSLVETVSPMLISSQKNPVSVSRNKLISNNATNQVHVTSDQVLAQESLTKNPEHACSSKNQHGLSNNNLPQRSSNKSIVHGMSDKSQNLLLGSENQGHGSPPYGFRRDNVNNASSSQSIVHASRIISYTLGSSSENQSHESSDRIEYYDLRNEILVQKSSSSRSQSTVHRSSQDNVRHGASSVSQVHGLTNKNPPNGLKSRSLESVVHVTDNSNLTHSSGNQSHVHEPNVEGNVHGSIIQSVHKSSNRNAPHVSSTESSVHGASNKDLPDLSKSVIAVHESSNKSSKPGKRTSSDLTQNNKKRKLDNLPNLIDLTKKDCENITTEQQINIDKSILVKIVELFDELKPLVDNIISVIDN